MWRTLRGFLIHIQLLQSFTVATPPCGAATSSNSSWSIIRESGLKRSTLPETATIKISSAANWAGGRLAQIPLEAIQRKQQKLFPFHLEHFMFGRVYVFFFQNSLKKLNWTSKTRKIWTFLLFFLCEKMFHQTISIVKTIPSEVVRPSVRTLSIPKCHLWNFLEKVQSEKRRRRPPICHNPNPFRQFPALYHTKKIEKNLRVLFFPLRFIPFSHRTPGQITSRRSEQKSEGNFVPGEKRGRSNCRDLAWLYFDLPPPSTGSH